MSGCHPIDVIDDSCEHGTNKNFSCDLCYLEKSITKCNEKLDKLDESVKYLLKLAEIRNQKLISTPCKHCNGKGWYYE